MGAFLVYMLKVAICLSAFYGFYYLLLSRETFHRCNRIALLGILGLAFLLPAFEWRTESSVSISALVEEVLVSPDLGAVESETGYAETFPFSWQETIVLVYELGVLLMLLRYVWTLGRVSMLVRRYRKEKLEDNYWLVILEKPFAPFSWMNYIVVSETDLHHGREEVLLHELAHIRNRHSWDLLFVGLCACLQWFNPVVWMLKTELQNIHEYEADKAVLRKGIDAKRYQLLLIEKAVGARLYSLANSFNHSSLKKRITMMIKKKSNPWARAKYLYVLPLAVVTVAAFARPEISRSLVEISAVKVSDFASNAEIRETENPGILPNRQEKGQTIRGMVCEKSDGKPIMGASVLLKGTALGTLTDEQGRFSLTGVPADGILQVSMIGYKTVNAILVGLSEEKLESGLVLYMDGKDIPQSSDEIKITGHDSQQKKMLLGETFQVVEVMPEYPGGMAECLRFLERNIKYPADAIKEKIEGRVIARFVIAKDGSVINPEILRSVSPSVDAEALRVIGLMPKWKAGKQRGQAVNVKYTLPVTFSLRNAEKKPEMTLGNTLILIDGVESSKEAMNRLPTDRIESISVLKDKISLEQYGEKGKDGVILIKTKDIKLEK